jgi:hypothetical protein
LFPDQTPRGGWTSRAQQSDPRGSPRPAPRGRAAPGRLMIAKPGDPPRRGSTKCPHWGRSLQAATGSPEELPYPRRRGASGWARVGAGVFGWQEALFHPAGAVRDWFERTVRSVMAPAQPVEPGPSIDDCRLLLRAAFGSYNRRYLSLRTRPRHTPAFAGDVDPREDPFATGRASARRQGSGYWGQ